MNKNSTMPLTQRKTTRELRADFVRISREVYVTWTAHSSDIGEKDVQVPVTAIRYFREVSRILNREQLIDAQLGNEIVADYIDSKDVPDPYKWASKE